ncbi:MAG TPA: T6SS immunity protein Tdi1 domain-containing protein [Acidimicrobiales bacterium]|nr:T6SS immunity protein Tdi1 domain-containing protein [Acidimicrobiales bacterium]
MLVDGMATMFGLDRAPVEATGRGEHPQLAKLYAELAGASFGGGLYRVHTPETGRRWTAVVEAAFPSMAGRIACFGSDWLGRQFALDRERRRGKYHLVLLLEPGTGDALEIPATVSSLHTDELVNQADAALALDFYADWREATGDEDFLDPDECVGYDVPPFLGGSDDLDNLTRIDMERYWSVAGQLLQGTAELPPGATIGDVARR